MAQGMSLSRRLTHQHVLVRLRAGSVLQALRQRIRQQMSMWHRHSADKSRT